MKLSKCLSALLSFFIVLITCFVYVPRTVGTQPGSNETVDTIEVLIHLVERADIEAGLSHAEVTQVLQRTAEISQASLLEYLEEKEAESRASYIESYYIVNVVYAEIVPDLLKTLENRPEVKKVYLNEVIRLDRVPSSAVGLLFQEGIPWSIQRTGAPEIWLEHGLDGSGIVIGIIDTGVDIDHPSLAENWRGHSQKTPDYNWYDPVYSRPMPDDLHSHGTRVTSLVLGHDQAAETTVGIAPGAQWIAARGFDDNGIGSRRHLLAAGQFMLAPTDRWGNNPDPGKAPSIILNAWGCSAISEDWYHEMVQHWRSASILPLFAAGNSGPKEETVMNPANYPEVFAVGATDSANKLAEFSSRGPGLKGQEVKPDLVAPGVGIITAVPAGGYLSSNGTSMAAAHVAGAAALLLSGDPGLQVDEIEDILKQTATPLVDDDYGQWPNYGYGYGLVNALAAVNRIQPKTKRSTIIGNIVVMPHSSLIVEETVVIKGNVVLKCETSVYTGPEPSGEIVKDY